MKRINVVGTSASGKTTFSKTLSRKLDLEYIELDALFWLNDWKQSSNELFFEKIQNRIDESPHGYVIDGNYTRSTHIKWKDIETVIWLDLPFHLNLFQSIKRTVNRLIFKEKLWGNSNNQESLQSVLSRDSIILWMMKTHNKNRKKYLAMMNDPQYSNIQFIRLRSRKAIQQFLNGLKV